VVRPLLAKVEREQKASSLSTARQALKAFREQFGHRPVGSITDVAAEDWINSVPPSSVPPLVTCMNYAVAMRVIAHNPFRGKSKRGRGRADMPPPSVKQLETLLVACDVLDDYAPQMQALIVFAAYTGMRPGELYELRWSDIDLARNRITVSLASIGVRWTRRSRTSRRRLRSRRQRGTCSCASRRGLANWSSSRCGASSFRLRP
jgi:integrase